MISHITNCILGNLLKLLNQDKHRLKSKIKCSLKLYNLISIGKLLIMCWDGIITFCTLVKNIPTLLYSIICYCLLGINNIFMDQVSIDKSKNRKK